MQKFFMFCTVIVLLITGCKKMEIETFEYHLTSGETVTITAPARDSDSVKCTQDMYPDEIYFGDTIYLITYDINISDNIIRGFNDSSAEISGASTVTITSDASHLQYSWKGESSSRSWDDNTPGGLRDLIPGEKRAAFKHYLEFPPLEDWGDPFWKEIQEKVSPDGVKCILTMTCRHHWHPDEPWEEYIETSEYKVEQEILIKPRPENEITLLEKWYKNTPKKLFPEVKGNRKIPYEMDLRSSGRSNITVGWWAYDPWLFIRLGNRKPSDPNNPQTLDEWRQLEASLTPSTMRDEVRLTRLQLEFYSAQKGEASEKAKNELVEWLKSLPEVQRAVMTTFLVSKMYDFHRTSLRDKNRELMRAIYDLLDHGCQEAVVNFESRNYRDRTLTPPAGVRVQRSLEEILEPTAEDLAHGTKELPDGFRIWNLIVNKKPVKQVAQFVELKEDEDRMIVKLRDGGNFPWEWIFSMLSEEDKQYAREQSRKAANGE